MATNMAKTAYLSTQLEPELKRDAEEVFKGLGLSTSEAVTLFFRQVVLHRGFPFPIKIPNEETLASFAEDISKLPRYTDGDAMMREILSETDESD